MKIDPTIDTRSCRKCGTIFPAEDDYCPICPRETLEVCLARRIGETPLDLFRKVDATALMLCSESEAEWEANEARVLETFGGNWPDWWRDEIILSRIAQRVFLSWSLPLSLNFVIGVFGSEVLVPLDLSGVEDTEWEAGGPDRYHLRRLGVEPTDHIACRCYYSSGTQLVDVLHYCGQFVEYDRMLSKMRKYRPDCGKWYRLSSDHLKLLPLE